MKGQFSTAILSGDFRMLDSRNKGDISMSIMISKICNTYLFLLQNKNLLIEFEFCAQTTEE